MNCPYTIHCTKNYCEYNEFYQVEEMKALKDQILAKYHKSPCPAPWKIMYWVCNHIRYMTDYKQFGVLDYWLFPDEILETGAEDCEGLSFLVASLLEAADYNTRVAIGQAPFGYHAWVEFCGDDGEWYIAETTTGKIFKGDDRLNMGYIPDLYIGPTGCAYPVEVDSF